MIATIYGQPVSDPLTGSYYRPTILFDDVRPIDPALPRTYPQDVMAHAIATVVGLMMRQPFAYLPTTDHDPREVQP